MKKTFFLLIPVLLIHCKSENSYNAVVKEASQVKQGVEAVNSAVAPKNQSTPTKAETSENEVEIIEPEAPLKEEKNKEEPVEIEEEKVVLKPKPKPKKPIKKANIKFDEYIHTFGHIEQGDIIEHEFQFTNTGKAPLNIKNTTATCGCTIPSYPFIPIAPGETGFIGVTYNSTGKLGKQSPTITVVSDASEPIIKLRLSGVVIPPEKEEVIEEEVLEEVIDTSSSQ